MNKILPVVMLALLGTANADVVQISPDTYVASRTSHAGAFANMSKLKATVIREANEYARRQGKIAIPISAKESRPNPGFPSFEYQFRIVDANDPEAKRTALLPAPDIVIERNESVSADVHTKDETRKKPDIYTELLKLDDLRKRGILTDAEFDAQKKSLLESAK